MHNSTLGFVSIRLGLRAPYLTLSADQFTEKVILDTAEALLHDDQKPENLESFLQALEYLLVQLKKRNYCLAAIEESELRVLNK